MTKKLINKVTSNGDRTGQPLPFQSDTFLSELTWQLLLERYLTFISARLNFDLAKINRAWLRILKVSVLQAMCTVHFEKNPLICHSKRLKKVFRVKNSFPRVKHVRKGHVQVTLFNAFKVCPHWASASAAAAAANTKSMEASTQASSGTFEVCRLPLGVG